MRRLSIARSVRTALLGLTIVLAAIAALGVAGLYSSRQHYEDRLSDALSLQASAGKVLAAGVVEEATLRTTTGVGAAAARRRARAAFALALDEARRLATADAPSARLVARAATAQAALRRRPNTSTSQPLAARAALSALATRQQHRIRDARADARRSSRRAVVAIVAGGLLALLAALGLVATLVARMRHPLEELVDASHRLAVGEPGVRVSSEGPGELEALGRSFNRMADDLDAAAAERDRLEQLKSEFVATASHELRSPLTSIKGFVELLSTSEGLDARQREFLDIVLVSTNRLVDLANDLLDVARVEAGRVEIHRRPIDLAEIVEETAALLRPRLDDKRQHLKLDIPAGLPRALADPGRTRQILTNLLTNAHLYTDEGGDLGVALRSEPHSVVLVVADRGRGMSEEEVEHAFDRFYRAGDGAGTSGTGLGLSIVRSLIELHHGSIAVESELGKGTTFTIHLPRATELAEPAAAHVALRGKRVLIVDDEPEIARLIATRVEPYGVEAVLTHSGEEALAQLREQHFDAMTLDILMPGMSGFDVLRALRSDPELERLPVVIVSVFSGREALSGEWLVSKPIDAAELTDALGAAILSGRVRVLVVGRASMRPRLAEMLDELGIEYEWAESAVEAARLCAARPFEVAMLDAGVEDPEGAMAALSLRGRRLRHSVIVFSAGGEAPGIARLDAHPVSIDDAGAVLLGLLEEEATA